MPLYLQQIKVEGEGIHPVFLNLGIAKWWWSASRPSHFALGYNVHYKWNKTPCLPGTALDNLRKDKILANAGIQTTYVPFTSPANTPTTLCRFLLTLAAGLLKC